MILLHEILIIHDSERQNHLSPIYIYLAFHFNFFLKLEM